MKTLVRVGLVAGCISSLTVLTWADDLSPGVMEPEGRDTSVFDLLTEEEKTPAPATPSSVNSPLDSPAPVATAPLPAPVPQAPDDKPTYERWASDPLSNPELSPSENPLSRDAEAAANAPTQELKTPESAPEPIERAKEHVVETDRVLDVPTQAVEAYEKARQEHVWKQSEPDWSFNLTLAPRAFRNADLRAPVSTSVVESKPRLTGVVLGGERVVMHNAGQIGVGGEFGFYGNTPRNQFGGLLTAVTTIGPFATYRGQFFPRQIVVPSIKAGVDLARVSYTYVTTRVRAIRAIPRFELGVLVYLNFLEPSSAGLMQSNYSVKRTYLAAWYSFATDSSKELVDLSESGAWRAGFRFEF
jgi:hypothetical protein